jgi:hypothetical protein
VLSLLISNHSPNTDGRINIAALIMEIFCRKAVIKGSRIMAALIKCVEKLK